MEQQGENAASKIGESLTGWWELAGVDTAVGETPVDWLGAETKAEPTQKPADPRALATDLQPVAAPSPLAEWPSDVETLKIMIASGAALPGNRFGTGFITPFGPSVCDVMLISDLPDQDEIDGRTLGGGATGALLSRMLRAIGINLTDCYWTALATTISPTGGVPDEALGELARFVRHQISLVKPKSVILLGSAASKALLGEELMKARAELRNINQDGSNMTTLTTFHPRTLIARPAMKAQAWKDLQMFAQRDGL